MIGRRGPRWRRARRRSSGNARQERQVGQRRCCVGKLACQVRGRVRSQVCKVVRVMSGTRAEGIREIEAGGETIPATGGCLIAKGGRASASPEANTACYIRAPGSFSKPGAAVALDHLLFK